MAETTTETMTDKMVALMDNRDELWRLFERACPQLEGESWKAPLGDMRTFYWRLADGETYLVHSWNEEAVTSKAWLEGTLMAEVKAVWRPEDADFVMMMIVDDGPLGLGGNSMRAVVLWKTHEREVEA